MSFPGRRRARRVADTYVVRKRRDREGTISELSGVGVTGGSAAEAYRARVRGCLLGGAIGDALGAPVEFWSLDRIRGTVGPAGVRAYLPCQEDGEVRHGLVTDCVNGWVGAATATRTR